MAGTIPLSMTQQFDEYGAPLAGGKLYIIQAGTVSTPQNAYVDTGLVTAQPYPMTLDAAGRVPQFFLDDSVSNLVKIRLQSAAGVVQLAADSVLIIGPSISGGGGGSTVDSTQLIQTGMMIFAHSTAQIAGFVRLNGRTIGSATSGATEKPSADCQALFLYLWPDTALTVSGGRGANAAADWAANKTIALPDWRGYGLGALDDMGNTASGRISSMSTSAVTLGGTGGIQAQSLTVANLPPYTPSGTINEGTITVTNNAPARTPNPSGTGADGPNQFPVGASTATITATQSGTTFSGTPQGGLGTAVNILGPRKLTTFYIKL
jgi:hypothetical protein